MPDSRPIKLTILHTNDLHGRVTELTRIAARVRQIRLAVQAAGGHCLYLDAGDSEDTLQLESSLTKGSSMNAILRSAGCDYVALGNAIPVRYGPQAIAGLAQAFGHRLLCANYYNERDQIAQGLAPYAIHDFGSFKLGLIGLTDVGPLTGKVYEVVFGLHPKQLEDILPGLIEEVRARGAQTLLLLSHLGLNQDRRLAETFAGVDVIIGGHSHDALNPPLDVNATVVAQAGDFGRFLGRVDFEIDPVSGKVTHCEGCLLPIDESIEPDPETQAAVEAERARVQSIMGRVIGTLTEPLALADDRECAAGNLLADALLERVPGAQAAFTLAGHWETGLEAGPLTQGQLFAANRSTANPTRAELTGAQIGQFLREALKPENAARSPHSLRGRKMGMPHVAGMSVRLDGDQLIVEVNGQPLQRERVYIVASTDMEFSEQTGYLVIPDEQLEYEVPTIMPEVLEAYIAKHSPVKKTEAGRITLV